MYTQTQRRLLDRATQQIQEQVNALEKLPQTSNNIQEVQKAHEATMLDLVTMICHASYTPNPTVVDQMFEKNNIAFNRVLEVVGVNDTGKKSDFEKLVEQKKQEHEIPEKEEEQEAPITTAAKEEVETKKEVEKIETKPEVAKPEVETKEEEVKEVETKPEVKEEVKEEVEKVEEKVETKPEEQQQKPIVKEVEADKEKEEQKIQHANEKALKECQANGLRVEHAHNNNNLLSAAQYRKNENYLNKID